MEIKLSYEEMSAYVQEHYGQTLKFSKAGEETLCVAYAKRVLIKTVEVPVNLKIERVTPSTVTVAYDGRVFGLDLVIGGALKAITALWPWLMPAITTGDGHRITVDLTRLKGGEELVKTVALRSIAVLNDGIAVTASLK